VKVILLGLLLSACSSYPGIQEGKWKDKPEIGFTAMSNPIYGTTKLCNSEDCVEVQCARREDRDTCKYDGSQSLLRKLTSGKDKSVTIEVIDRDLDQQIQDCISGDDVRYCYRILRSFHHSLADARDAHKNRLLTFLCDKAQRDRMDCQVFKNSELATLHHRKRAKEGARPSLFKNGSDFYVVALKR
jgi:hypothetical protein